MGKGTADHPPFGEAADHHAKDPQVSGSPFAARGAKNYEEPRGRGSAADFLGRRSGKGTADYPPFGEDADRHANDRQVSGASFASLLSRGDRGARGSAAQFSRARANSGHLHSRGAGSTTPRPRNATDDDESDGASQVRGRTASARGRKTEEPSSGEESEGDVVAARDLAVLRTLADHWNLRGTAAIWLNQAARAVQARPGYPGMGIHYKAWTQALSRTPSSPVAAVDRIAPELAYLVRMNGESEFSVLHHLHRWRSPEGVRSRLNNRIVAFEGEVRSEHGLPLLFRFDEDDDKLLQLQLLPSGLANHAADFYRDGQQDDEFHRGQVPPRQDYRGNTTATGGRLIPIPVSWAPFFLDYPNMGLAFRRLIHLMWGAEPRDRGHLKPFSNGIALACGTPHPTDDSPCSALDSLWKRVPYTRTTLAGATAAWENHRGTPTAPRKDPPELGEFDSMFGEREEEGNGGWGDSWGYVLPNTPPPPPVAGQRTGPDSRTTESRTESTDLRSVLVAVLDAQSRAQIAVADNHHANLLAFHSLTAQALAARGSDKDSKLTPAKKRILQACAGIADDESFVAEPVFHDVDAEGGTAEALGRILRKRLMPVPNSPHQTNIYTTPQLIATVKSFNFSSNGDKTHVGCTKGITVFATPWRTVEAMNEDAAEETYFEAATLKSVADIRKHVTGAKVELPSTFQGLLRVFNNYARLLEVLFGAECDHLTMVLAIRDGLERHETDLELRLTTVLILHLMWRVHHDARQFFVACEAWEQGEPLPRSALGLTVQQLVNDCSIQSTLTCPTASFLGRTGDGQPVKPPAACNPKTGPTNPQATSNPSVPLLCQKAVAAFTKAHPGLTISDLCRQGGVKMSMLQGARKGVCLNFGLLGRCKGCSYKHEVLSILDERQTQIAKAMERGMVAMKAGLTP